MKIVNYIYNYRYIIYTFVSIFLFWKIINLFFNDNAFLFEGFDTNTPLTNHTVDLPINNKYDCKNFCGPQSQCSITREQCTSDVDCYGCKPPLKKQPKYLNAKIYPDNDSGKLTWNQTPQYSHLTSDIGTKAKFYKKGSKNAEIPMPYQGVNYWEKYYNYGMKIADEEMTYDYSGRDKKYVNIPNYPARKSVTGLFNDNGPTPSNAYLS
jgi:hypothetical protein